MKICIAGACGRMGQRILEMTAAADDIEVGSAFDLPEQAGTALAYGAAESGGVLTLSGSAKEAIVDVDVLIDFTHAEACLGNVAVAVDRGTAVVIGTTGLSPGQRQEIKTAAEEVPIVFAPNMSVGVNVLFKLVAQAAQALGLDYNVEITEIHHNQKKDSPSGTAVRLAELAAHALDLDYEKNVAHGRHGDLGARPRREIGMHALRGGDVAGEHTVAFIGEGERIELTHRAHNRDNFARGALVAARFAVSADPGLYDMQDVLGLR